MPSWEMFVAALQDRDIEHERHPLLSPMEARAVALLRRSASNDAEDIMRALARGNGQDT